MSDSDFVKTYLEDFSTLVRPDDQIVEIRFLEQGEIAFAVDGQVSEYFNRDTKDEFL